MTATNEPVDELCDDFFYCNNCGEITMRVDIKVDEENNYICGACESDNLDFFEG